GFPNPEGCIAIGGLASPIDCDVNGDVDGKELVFLVPLVLSSDLVDGQTGGDAPGATISGPDRCCLHRLLISVGTEPHGAISRFAESLGGGEELIQGHCLTECETLGK